MNATATGWVMFVAAMSMMCGLLAIDIAKIMSWNDVGSPAFVAEFIGHLSAVGMAFVGGKLIPS